MPIACERDPGGSAQRVVVAGEATRAEAPVGAAAGVEPDDPRPGAVAVSASAAGDEQATGGPGDDRGRAA